MDFLVKVGDTGLAFPYTNIPPNEKFPFSLNYPLYCIEFLTSKQKLDLILVLRSKTKS